MKIEIDQSGKVEKTEKLTVIADSLGNAICLSASDKRTLQQYYRNVAKPRIFVSEVFGFMVAYLVAKQYSPGNLYCIDMEYPGKENEIKTFVFRFLKRFNCTAQASQITFGYIGKKSRAHNTAYTTFISSSKKKAYINLRKILQFVA